MKKFIFSIFCLTLSACVLGSETDKPEVVFIGTLHQDTDQFTSNDLLTTLRCIAPDVILVERDKYMLAKNGWYLDNDKPELEEKAVRKYREESQFAMHPYDYEGRNRYKLKHQFRDRSKALQKDIDTLKAEGALSPLSLQKLAHLDSVTTAMLGLFNDPLRVINSEVASAIVKQRKSVIYDTFDFLIDEQPSLAKHKAHWQRVRNFWIARNDAMVENILTWANQYPGKIIVVLSGVSHKYYIKERLLQASSTLDYREYWQRKNCE